MKQHNEQENCYNDNHENPNNNEVEYCNNDSDINKESYTKCNKHLNTINATQKEKCYNINHENVNNNEIRNLDDNNYQISKQNITEYTEKQNVFNNDQNDKTQEKIYEKVNVIAVEIIQPINSLNTKLHDLPIVTNTHLHSNNNHFENTDVDILEIANNVINHQKINDTQLISNSHINNSNSLQFSIPDIEFDNLMTSTQLELLHIESTEANTQSTEFNTNLQTNPDHLNKQNTILSTHKNNAIESDFELNNSNKFSSTNNSKDKSEFSNSEESKETSSAHGNFLSIVHTTDENIQNEEYNIITKKVASSSIPNRQVSITDGTVAEKCKNSYIFDDGKFTLKNQQIQYLNEYFMHNGSITNKKEFTKCIEDMVRQSYKDINNVCPINFVSHAFTKKEKKMRLYAKCIYKETCRNYKFCIDLHSSPINISVSTNKPKITHPQQKKVQQIRGLRRSILKNEIKDELPSNFRNNMLRKMSNKLCAVGNLQQTPTKDVAKKLKSEANKRFIRHKDIFQDLLMMQKEKKWKAFIQRISIPAEIYLFSKEQLKLLNDSRKLILQSRNTIYIDATGSIVKKIENSSKRMFLYALILHIPEIKGCGILLPVAEAIICRHFEEDIKKFFMEIKVYCLINKIKWPLSKRICCDWSWAIINSSIKIFNDMEIETYLRFCYNILNNQQKLPNNFVIIQICYCHFFKICMKDIENLAENEDQKSYFKKMIIKAINTSDINEIWQWLKNICIILQFPADHELIKNAMEFINDCGPDIDIDAKEAEMIIINEPIYKKSPFYEKGINIYKSIKVPENCGKKSNLENAKYLNLILKKYVPYIPWWTNCMGSLVETTNKTRISNSPAESYFHITKNITLKGKRNIRPTNYIRNSKKYIHSKIIEISNKYNIENNDSNSPTTYNNNNNNSSNSTLNEDICKQTPKKNNIKNNEVNTNNDCNSPTIFNINNPTNNVLIEDTWKRTPKKIKETSTIKRANTEKYFNNSNSLTDLYNKVKTPEISSCSISLFNYSHIYNTLYEEIPITGNTITLEEYQSLNPRQLIYNNIMELYINIIFLKNNIKNAKCFPCEIAMEIFNSNLDVELDILDQKKKVEHIFMPLFKSGHYTLVYINTTKKEFLYLDPQIADQNTIEEQFEKFKNNLKINDKQKWICKKVTQYKQIDGHNCGVICCQFAEAIIKNNSLKSIINPNKYRKIIQNDLISYGHIPITCIHCNAEDELLKCIKCSRSVDMNCIKTYYLDNKDNFQCLLCKNMNI